MMYIQLKMICNLDPGAKTFTFAHHEGKQQFGPHSQPGHSGITHLKLQVLDSVKLTCQCTKNIFQSAFIRFSFRINEAYGLSFVSAEKAF